MSLTSCLQTGGLAGVSGTGTPHWGTPDLASIGAKPPLSRSEAWLWG